MAKRLQAKGIEVFLPVFTIERQWADRKKTVTFPLFPARIFARFGSASADGMYVFNTPGLYSRHRVEIPDSEIETLKTTLSLGCPCTTAALPISGIPARIPEASVSGVLVESGDPCRVAVAFPTVGHAVVVEVPADRVQYSQ